MTDYVEITDTQVDPDAPLTSQLAYQWRDNWIAGFEGAAGAPRLAIKPIAATNTTATAIPGGYSGFSAIINYTLITSIAGSATLKLQFSGDGSTWPASLTLVSVGTDVETSGDVHIFVDFSTGDYFHVGAIGTIGSMPSTPTHFRILAVSTTSASANLLSIMNGGFSTT